MAVLIEYTLKAKEDIDHFKSSGQTQILKKIRGLVEAIAQNPYTGIGKPKPLRHNLQGLWSRRINSEHRIVYEIEDQMVFILSCRGHYLGFNFQLIVGKVTYWLVRTPNNEKPGNIFSFRIKYESANCQLFFLSNMLLPARLSIMLLLNSYGGTLY